MLYAAGIQSSLDFFLREFLTGSRLLSGASASDLAGYFPREILPMQCIGKMPVNLMSLAFWQKCYVAAFKAICGSRVGNGSPRSWHSSCDEGRAPCRKLWRPSGNPPPVRYVGRVRNV